jgi:hypothetical protein
MYDTAPVVDGVRLGRFVIYPNSVQVFFVSHLFFLLLILSQGRLDCHGNQSLPNEQMPLHRNQRNLVPLSAAPVS